MSISCCVHFRYFGAYSAGQRSLLTSSVSLFLGKSNFLFMLCTCVIILDAFLCRPLQNNVLETCALGGEREPQRLIILYRCFKKIIAVFEIQFLDSLGSDKHSKCGRRGGLMVSALDSGASGPGRSPGWGHCVVFLGKTLYSHSASLHPNGYRQVVGETEQIAGK